MPSNEKYGTTKGAMVIAGLFVVLWGLTVLAMIESWGAIFFTFVIAAVIVIPFMAVCAGAIMIYTFAVHGYAHVRNR
ncbi:MAG: hypothetical protein AAF389_20010 [Gemmatimonadota bacterium]